MVKMVNKEKWNAFTNQMLHLMMKAEQCADVTLVCDDVQRVKTHSILNAYSLVFRDIFQLLAKMFDETVPKREEIKPIRTPNSDDFIFEDQIPASQLDNPSIASHSSQAQLENMKNEDIKSPECLHDDDITKTQKIENDVKPLEEEVKVSKKNTRKKKKHQGLIQPKLTLTYNCSHCDHSGGHENLILHMKTKHEGQKYNCKQCEYQCETLQSLRNHIKIKHEGVRHVCKLCDYKANYRVDLRTHIQSKHEGVTYPCELCGKVFTERNNLRKHIQYKHEGMRHVCEKCQYQATTRGSLQNHIQSKHENLKYYCDKCSFDSKIKSSLKKHIVSQHSLDTECYLSNKTN